MRPSHDSFYQLRREPHENRQIEHQYPVQYDRPEQGARRRCAVEYAVESSFRSSRRTRRRHNARRQRHEIRPGHYLPEVARPAQRAHYQERIRADRHEVYERQYRQYDDSAFMITEIFIGGGKRIHGIARFADGFVVIFDEAHFHAQFHDLLGEFEGKTQFLGEDHHHDRQQTRKNYRECRPELDNPRYIIVIYDEKRYHECVERENSYRMLDERKRACRGRIETCFCHIYHLERLPARRPRGKIVIVFTQYCHAKSQPETVTVTALAYEREVYESVGQGMHHIRAEREKEPIVIATYLPAEFRLMLPEMSLMPLYELLEKLFVIFRMDMIEEQDAYLCAFYDAVTEYMQNNSSELTSFLSYWNETLYAKTIPSGEISGIRILSIHKSKGLEYHTVLLPFCDWKMENETFNHMLWCKINEADADKEPFCELDLTPVNYSSAMAESYFSDSYKEERLQLWVDNLNLLYVAFTRACKNLIVWCKDEQKDTVSRLLRESIDCMKDIKMVCNIPEPDDEDKEGNTEENDEPIIYEYGEICISCEKKKSDFTNRLVAIPEAVNVKIESLETEIDFKQSNRSADFIRGDEDEEENLRSQYIRQGQLLHTLFASIETKDDLPAAIERLLFEGVIESAEKAEEISKVAERALNLDEVKDWYSGEWTLYNECSIIYNDEQGKMQTRRPDRVMMKGNEVVVVDFKFGKKKPEYSTQVREYMSLLSDMGYTDIKGYIWYVYSGELENV